jgi:hypothetical protein
VATEQAIAAAVEREVTRTNAPEVDDLAARMAILLRDPVVVPPAGPGRRSRFVPTGAWLALPAGAEERH